MLRFVKYHYYKFLVLGPQVSIYPAKLLFIWKPNFRIGGKKPVSTIVILQTVWHIQLAPTGSALLQNLASASTAMAAYAYMFTERPLKFSRPNTQGESLRRDIVWMVDEGDGW